MNVVGALSITSRPWQHPNWEIIHRDGLFSLDTNIALRESARLAHLTTIAIQSIAMAVPQIISRSSCLISGRAPTCLARSLAIRAKIPAQRRQLVTTVKLWQETIETQSRGPEVPLTSFTSEPKGSHARSVALLKVNKRAVRKDIEELVRSKGLDV